MTNQQLLMSFAAGLLFVFAPYLETSSTGKFSFYDVAIFLLLSLFWQISSASLYILRRIKIAEKN